MYELRNINCKAERNSHITLRLTVYISQLIHHAQAYSLYFTTHTLLSGLQFIFLNSYITLRLAVYISQLIHHAQACSLHFTTHTSRSGLVYISQLTHYTQAYSLYFTTHTLRSGLQFIFHNSYITLRLTVYISPVSMSVMYELRNINCKAERNVWVVKYKLLA
jgi:hypothetical protein